MNRNPIYHELPQEIMYTYLHPNGQSSLVMPSSFTSMLKLERFVASLKTMWQIHETAYIKMNVALNEMVTNAIIHGNHSSPEKNVYVQAIRSADRYTFMVRDQGPGFDHTHLVDPFDPNNEDVNNGQGIFIARNLSDELHFAPKGNCVWMLFRRSA